MLIRPSLTETALWVLGVNIGNDNLMQIELLFEIMRW